MAIKKFRDAISNHPDGNRGIPSDAIEKVMKQDQVDIDGKIAKSPIGAAEGTTDDQSATPTIPEFGPGAEVIGAAGELTGDDDLSAAPATPEAFGPGAEVIGGYVGEVIVKHEQQESTVPGPDPAAIDFKPPAAQ